MKARLSILYPYFGLYSILAVLILLTKQTLISRGVEIRVLHVANTLLVLVGCMASWWVFSSFQKQGGKGVLKALYGGFMIRFFILALSAFIYILSKRKQVNIPGLAGAAAFYILYQFVEIKSSRSFLKSDQRNV